MTAALFPSILSGLDGGARYSKSRTPDTEEFKHGTTCCRGYVVSPRKQRTIRFLVASRVLAGGGPREPWKERASSVIGRRPKRRNGTPDRWSRTRSDLDLPACFCLDHLPKALGRNLKFYLYYVPIDGWPVQNTYHCRHVHSTRWSYHGVLFLFLFFLIFLGKKKKEREREQEHHDVSTGLITPRRVLLKLADMFVLDWNRLIVSKVLCTIISHPPTGPSIKISSFFGARPENICLALATDYSICCLRCCSRTSQVQRQRQ